MTSVTTSKQFPDSQSRADSSTVLCVLSAGPQAQRIGLRFARQTSNGLRQTVTECSG